MEHRSFSKPPHLTQQEKDKRAEAFLSFADEEAGKEPLKERKLQKEQTKPLFLRIPKSLWTDIHEIMALTGLSMNAVCLELVRPAVKRKLREIKEE